MSVKQVCSEARYVATSEGKYCLFMDLFVISIC